MQTREALTILEDDTVLVGDFAAASQRVLDEVPDWQLVVWGWNFDVLLWAEIPEGVSPCRLGFDQEMMREKIGAFPADRRPRAPVRLRHFFGTHAYSITPAGAAIMLDACLPMTDRLIRFCDGSVFHNLTKDTDVAAAVGGMRAYACMPPLALF